MYVGTSPNETNMMRRTATATRTTFVMTFQTPRLMKGTKRKGRQRKHHRRQLGQVLGRLGRLRKLRGRE